MLYLFRPHTKQSSRKENLGRIVSYYEIAKAKTTHEGERYEGVFVDFDNTLVDFETQEINHKVLELIEQYQKKGKEIIVRTLGDIAKK
ncbi:MAG: hypothetical protein LBU27_05630 [Candidatus Peribacteria bacterium]|nr:hypothetical protein [Candidatus Peribacteria bacterium]